MNVTTFTGNLGRDWELQYSAGGSAYAKNSLAVQRDFKDKQTGEYKTDWVPLTAFGRTAETLANYTKKGSKIEVVGHLQVDQYQNKEGENRTSYDIIVDRFGFLDSKKDNQQQGGYQQPKQQDPFAGNSDQISISEQDLPF